MFDLERGHYLVVREPNSKPFLMQLTSIKKDTLSGLLEKDRHLDPTEVEIKKKNILINLGPEPSSNYPNGKVYGVETNDRYITNIKHSVWGDIFFFVRLDKDTKSILRHSLDRTANKIQKLKLEHLIEGTITEIRAKQGRWAGKYIHSKKENEPSRMLYAPDWAEGSPKAMDYVILHEFGHRVRFAGITSKKLRARWLKVYNKSIAQIVVDPSIFTKGLSERQDGELTLRQALKEIIDDNEDYKSDLKVIARWFKQVHHLGFRELALLWDTQDYEVFNSLWPENEIDSSDLNPIISTYGCKNFEEMFAEVFSMHFTGQKIPGKIAEFLEKSLATIEVADPQKDTEEEDDV
jgi:hypothetical protein